VGADSIARATSIQRRAAAPDHSVALRASAGSGKTRVLVDRFLRLCIEETPARAHPRAILAVTFTKKAAVEIRERLLLQTTTMAAADEASLRDTLRTLFGDRSDPEPTSQELARAWGLYELVLEDSTGLNVGTIHSFCQTILGRFAAEVGLDPHTRVLENPKELLDEALERLERETVRDPQLSALAQQLGKDPNSTRHAMNELLESRMRLERWLSRLSAAGVPAPEDEPDPVSQPIRPVRADTLEPALVELREALFGEEGVDGSPTLGGFVPPLRVALKCFVNEVTSKVSRALGADFSKSLPDNLAKLVEKATSVLAAMDERSVGDAHWADEMIERCQDVFLTKDKKVRTFSRIRDPELKSRYIDSIIESALPVFEVLRRVRYLELYQQNHSLLGLGLRLLDIYDELKDRDRVVDFQDLEAMARQLMADSGRAVSLLYRLDDSLQHILLDEFQDTNFNQWDILEPFVAEFLSGDAAGRRRTVFFVGDGKQSIYGFRGAKPLIFQQVCRLLESRGQSVLSLPTNFRSLGAVVDSVGCLFKSPPLADSLDPGEVDDVAQAWARGEAPGQVRIVSPFVAEGSGNDEEEPHQEPDARRSGDQRAAGATAHLIAALVNGAAQTWQGHGDALQQRSLRWRDILVLCRSRTGISVYEKALRGAGIPVEPAGRGMLAAGREIQDLLALLRWLIWPEDDVALATVLRSPLGGLDEAGLQTVLARRGLQRHDGDGIRLPPHGLWRVLRKETADPVVGPVVSLLHNWRKHLGFEDCHALLRRIYREGRVLERYEAVRGEQARHNLLRLFDLSLSPELAGAPTIRRLADLITRAAREGGHDEGAAPAGEGQGRVRVMTIHGAKGLEAPVVLLIDADRVVSKESAVVPTDPDSSTSPILFKVTKTHRDGLNFSSVAGWSLDCLQRSSLRARHVNRIEDANLLYVALTRARDRLYVLGGDLARGNDHSSPLRQIQASAVAGGCRQLELVDAEDLVAELAQARPDPPERAEAPDTGGRSHRKWQPPLLGERYRIVTPSTVATETAVASGDVGAGPTVTSSADRQAATERGNRVHLLLQLAADNGHLPKGSGALYAEAATVVDDPSLAWIFAPESIGGTGLSEVALVHRRTGVSKAASEERVTGIIDRMVIRPDSVDIIDYKTNRVGGDQAAALALADHYRPQLQSYREAVQALYPSRRVRTWLLLTDPDLGPGIERLQEVD